MDKREAFRMHLKPGCAAEYAKRHRDIWPEVKKKIEESGVYDYSIFLDEETGNLFAFQRTKGDKGSQDLGSEEIIQKWWDYMKDLMDTNPDNSPVSIPLREVFRME